MSIAVQRRMGLVMPFQGQIGPVRLPSTHTPPSGIFLGPPVQENPQGEPWNAYTQYNPGDTVTYNGAEWQAVTTVPAGVYPGLSGDWQQISSYSGLPAQLTTGNVPTGSYSKSCQQISMQGDTLYALCQRIDGSWVQSSLPNVSQYVPGSIYNQDGVLGGQLLSGGQVIPFPVNTPVPGVGNVTTGVDPNTGQVFATVPPSGPQPPGAGYEQIESSGPYPYVYVGGGAAASGNLQGLPWAPSTQYNPGDTVTYNGMTWQALTTVPAGVYPGLAGYWQEVSTSLYPYGATPGLYYNTQAGYPSSTAASSTALPPTSTATSFSSWFAQNESLVIGGGLGLVGLIVLLRMTKR